MGVTEQRLFRSSIESRDPIQPTTHSFPHNHLYDTLKLYVH